LYEEFIKANPWPVVFEDSVKPKVEGYHAKRPMMVGVLERVVSRLETFPPDDHYFKNPRPSLHDMRIWLTVSEGRLRFMLKVEYRLELKTCFIVQFVPKS
jgi:hypothetical protein